MVALKRVVFELRVRSEQRRAGFMARSTKKGPFIDGYLATRIEQMNGRFEICGRLRAKDEVVFDAAALEDEPCAGKKEAASADPHPP